MSRTTRSPPHLFLIQRKEMVTGAAMSSVELARELERNHAAVSFHVRGDRSPITHVRDVRNPVVVVQGLHDSRTTADQMSRYETEMRAQGKEIRLLWLDAGHGLPGGTDEERTVASFLDAAKALVGR